MGFFDWESESISRYIWVYFLGVAVITLCTLLTFYHLVLKKKDKARDGSV